MAIRYVLIYEVITDANPAQVSWHAQITGMMLLALLILPTATIYLGY